MEPTTPTTQTSHSGPPVVGQGLVEVVRTNRQNAATGLLAVAALLLALAGYFAVKAFDTAPAEPSAAEKEKEKNDTFAKSPPKTAETEAQAARAAKFNLAWLGLLAGALVVGAGGGWLMARPPSEKPDQQRTEVRVLVLWVGGLLGTVLCVFGCLFFVEWSDSLIKWLNNGETREAKWVLIPLLMVILGAGLIFLAIQPARAEERNNASIRKVVYGANFALTTLLLLVAIVVANVVFALKVPNRLDTTETGFYAISDSSKNLLSRLAEPVNAYAVLEGTGRRANDIRQLLLAFEDASAGKFKVKFLSEVHDKVELASLQKKHTRFETILNQRLMTSENEETGAVLLTAGPDESRDAVIAAREFGDPEGRTFHGEARLFKEVAFLADSAQRPTIYFTQGHGELSIEPFGGQIPPDRSATRLRGYLDNRYLTVRTLDLSAASPSVPDDATVVVVADPTRALSEPAAGALRKYMSTKKGKLIVLVGASAGADRRMVSTGLEPLLGDLGVRLGTRFLFTLPTPEMPYPDVIEAAFSVSTLDNPGFEAFVKAYPVLRFVRAREVEPQPTGQAFQATELILSTGPTWPEDQDLAPAELSAVVKELRATAKAQQVKGVSRQPRPLALTVTESQTSRAVVIGCSFFVTDAAAQIRQFQAQTTRASFALVGTCIDWLRERPSLEAAEIESKKYTEYTFPSPSTVDRTRLRTLPLLLAMLLIGGVGAGVWLVRRK
jgi:hypothetical protein